MSMSQGGWRVMEGWRQIERNGRDGEEGWAHRGRDGRRDGGRNVTDGLCLARAGREQRGWHHRVREHTHTHTHPVGHVHSHVQERFRCLLCQQNTDHMTNRRAAAMF